MKSYGAECLGTFVLVFGGCGSAVLAADHIGYAGVAAGCPARLTPAGRLSAGVLGTLVLSGGCPVSWASAAPCKAIVSAVPHSVQQRRDRTLM